MTDLKPNAELAYRVMDYIDENPGQHDQHDFVRHAGTAATIAADAMPCGTTACFAGWTVLLSGLTLDLRGLIPKTEFEGRLVDVDDAAAQLLGIGNRGLRDGAPHALFYEADTRAELGQLVEKYFGPRPESYGTGCCCTYLGEGTPEHSPSGLCQPEPCGYPLTHPAHGWTRLANDERPEDKDEWCAGVDEAAIVVDHGPVKPPYGTPEREAYDREHGGGEAPC